MVPMETTIGHQTLQSKCFIWKRSFDSQLKKFLLFSGLSKKRSRSKKKAAKEQEFEDDEDDDDEGDAIMDEFENDDDFEKAMNDEMNSDEDFDDDIIMMKKPKKR